MHACFVSHVMFRGVSTICCSFSLSLYIYIYIYRIWYISWIDPDALRTSSRSTKVDFNAGVGRTGIRQEQEVIRSEEYEEFATKNLRKFILAEDFTRLAENEAYYELHYLEVA